MSERFDDLARALAQGHSRRRAIQTFITGLFASLFALLVPSSAAPAEGFTGGRACVKYCLQLKGLDRQRCLDQAHLCSDACGMVDNTIACGPSTCINYCLQQSSASRRRFCLERAHTCSGGCVLVQSSLVCL